MKKLSILLALLLMLSCITLVACGETEVEEDELVNYYYSGDTFAISKWYSGVTGDVFDISVDQDNVTTVNYTKPSGTTYPQVMSVTSGDLSQFNYFNITVKSDAINTSVMIQAPLTYGDGEDDVAIVFETTQTIETEYTTYSIAITKGNRPQLNHMDGVWVFPEPGSSGTGIAGTITISEAYFSVAVPENTTVIDSTDSSGDTPVYRYGDNQQWSNEYTWTNYVPSTNEQGEVRIYSASVAEYAPIIRTLDGFTLDCTTIEFTFQNVVRTDGYSVDEISFYLRGDKKEYVVPDTGYAYWSYYEYLVDQYLLEEDGAGEDGTITLTLDVSTAKYTLLGHMEEGVSLVLFVESRPVYNADGTSERLYDGVLEMQVLSVSFS